jgi:hypothetical protein
MERADLHFPTPADGRDDVLANLSSACDPNRIADALTMARDRLATEPDDHQVRDAMRQALRRERSIVTSR